MTPSSGNIPPQPAGDLEPKSVPPSPASESVERPRPEYSKPILKRRGQLESVTGSNLVW